jgi:hypothetical protein
VQSGIRLKRRSFSPVVAMAAAGALWGAATYEILWGNTDIVVTRRFVDSVAGLATLLPVRIVLFAIHVVEDRIVGHPFNFSNNHRWIGFVATAVGAILLAGAFLLGRAAATAIRAVTRRRPTLAAGPPA